LVLEDQSVDQLMAYFPNRKDPNLLMIYARLTDEKHAADVEAAINETLARARTELVDTKRLEDTKSRLRYLFTSQLDSAGGIGSVLAAYVQFDRTPETINEVYQSYDALTPEDIRDAANRYFADSGRVTVSLSSSESMAGIDGKSSIDALAETLAADAGTATDTAPIDEPKAETDQDTMRGAAADPVAQAGQPGGAAPVSIVAQPSAS